ncbi:MAG: hypothetical protein AB1813_07470 [Verrucomicrobiota bacterium]
MKIRSQSLFLLTLFALGALLAPLRTPARVLDNFNDNTKTGWTDFTFVPGFGLPSESGGQFRFEQPAAGQAIFSASQKTSEVFELKDGRTIEFRVDVVQGGGKDSFAVLAFIPTSGSPGTLAGYGFAKSTTDILITKGINKYFVNEATGLKQDNITLVLSLSAKGGNVTIRATALDKDDNNAVLWEKTVVDTPAADVLADGSDSPAAPYITSGYFTLYLYQDFDSGAVEDPYRAIYDDAEVFVTDSAVLDDFNDNVKTSWTDFTFVPGFGIPSESGGQFRFEQPAAGQAIFSASQKTSRVFDLVEGERIEFSVDVIQGGGKDSFAVLAFIPTSGSPGTLAGYGFAKSTTDILITKGINKYFVNEATALKQDNITLSLSLTARNGSVTIVARAFDKDDNNALLWEKTAVDTPAADVLADGSDSPAAPYITGGYFTLYLYQDFASSAPEDPYRAIYDDAIVAAPPQAANVAPIISDVAPPEFGNFLPVSTVVSFKVTDDKTIPDNKLSITLNGTAYTTANGLTISGTGGAKTASLAGKLTANVNYTAVLSAEDSEGEKASRTIYFDTFAQDSLVVEIEDYNFENGRFFDNPVPIIEGFGPQDGSYSYQTGVQDVDFNDTRTSPRPQDTLYRPFDPVRMQHTLDNARKKFVDAGGTASGVYDYDVGDIAEGEWLNYTRTFPPGSYEVYLREALANMATGDSVLEQVTGDRTQPGQSVRLLGSFLGTRTGFQYRNFPLTDGSGQNKTILRLSGVTTLRLRQVTPDAADGARYQNYLIFIPVSDPGLQRAAITSISPAPNSETATASPSIRVEIQNRDTAVKVSSIKLELNGQVVAPIVTSDANGAVVTYAISPLPASGAVNTAKVSFQDNFNEDISTEWTFVVTYLSLDPANRRLGTPGERGMKVRMVQAPAGSNLANDLQRAEDQLAPNSSIPSVVDFSDTIQIVNMAQDDRVSGFFDSETLVPGLDPDLNGTEDFVVEMQTWLELPAGVHRFGVISDDGYIISSGAQTSDKRPTLGFHNGGPANETNGGLFDFVVKEPGFYPFRMMWYERGGNAYAEWYSVNLTTGDRTLINDPNSAGAIKAFLSVTAPSIVLEGSATVTGPYAQIDSAIVDANARTVTLNRPVDTRFYRLRAGTALRIKQIQIASDKLVLTFE